MGKNLAIQLFGHMRTFKNTYESFFSNVVKSAIDQGYCVDIFIHTWSEKDHNTVNWRNQNGIKISSEILQEKDIEEIKELYHPKEIVVEEQLSIEEKIITEKVNGVKRSIKGCLNNSYTIYQVNELRKKYEIENNVIYDWVLCTRPDIFFKKELKIDFFLEQYTRCCFAQRDNALYYAYNDVLKINDERCIKGSDLIYFSNPDVMDKATSLYKNFDKNIDVDNFYCFEVWWLDFWKSQDIIPMGIKYLFSEDWIVLYEDMLLSFSAEYKKEKSEQNIIVSSESLHSDFVKKVYFLRVPIFKIIRKKNILKIKLFNLFTIIKIKDKKNA